MTATFADLQMFSACDQSADGVYAFIVDVYHGDIRVIEFNRVPW